jgi:hypothetical protein
MAITFPGLRRLRKHVRAQSLGLCERIARAVMGLHRQLRADSLSDAPVAD